jgi:hypothetical protein
LSTYRSNDPIENVYIKDSLAYVSAGNSGILILNYSDPENPSLISFYDTDGSTHDLRPYNEFVIAADHTSFGIYIADTLRLSASERQATRLQEYYLSGIAPNPFNGTTQIHFSLPLACQTKLHVFDLCGREVATLVNGKLSGGLHSITWNAEGLSSGTYLVNLETPNFSSTKKMMMLK